MPAGQLARERAVTIHLTGEGVLPTLDPSSTIASHRAGSRVARTTVEQQRIVFASRHLGRVRTGGVSLSYP